MKNIIKKIKFFFYKMRLKQSTINQWKYKSSVFDKTLKFITYEIKPYSCEIKKGDVIRFIDSKEVRFNVDVIKLLKCYGIIFEKPETIHFTVGENNNETV